MKKKSKAVFILDLKNYSQLIFALKLLRGEFISFVTHYKIIGIAKARKSYHFATVVTAFKRQQSTERMQSARHS